MDAPPAQRAGSERGNRRHPVPLEEGEPTLDDAPPGGEITIPVSAVAVLVCVLELVERAIFGVEQLPVALQESLVDRVARVPHTASSSESGLHRSRTTVPHSSTAGTGRPEGAQARAVNASATPKRFS